jgi:hypothetical protein
MARQRSHSIAFKRQVAQEFIATPLVIEKRPLPGKQIRAGTQKSVQVVILVAATLAAFSFSAFPLVVSRLGARWLLARELKWALPPPRKTH